jgi:hypothetical protein
MHLGWKCAARWLLGLSLQFAMSSAMAGDTCAGDLSQWPSELTYLPTMELHEGAVLQLGPKTIGGISTLRPVPQVIAAHAISRSPHGGKTPAESSVCPRLLHRGCSASCPWRLHRELQRGRVSRAGSVHQDADRGRSGVRKRRSRCLRCRATRWRRASWARSSWLGGRCGGIARGGVGRPDAAASSQGARQ